MHLRIRKIAALRRQAERLRSSVQLPRQDTTGTYKRSLRKCFSFWSALHTSQIFFLLSAWHLLGSDAHWCCRLLTKSDSIVLGKYNSKEMLLQWNHPHNLVEACCLKSSTALANFDPGGALFHTLPTVFTKFLHQSPLDSHRLTNHHNYARSFNTPRNRINLADDAQKLTHHNHNWQTKSLGIRLEILTRFRTHYQDNGDIVLPSHTFTTFFLTSQDIPTSITKKFVLNQQSPRCQRRPIAIDPNENSFRN
mgnify:CR=1 FL=1